MNETITIYEAFLKKDRAINRAYMRRIGLKARDIYKQITNEYPAKEEREEQVAQTYRGKKKANKFSVFVYPAEFSTIIFNLINEIPTTSKASTRRKNLKRKLKALKKKP